MCQGVLVRSQIGFRQLYQILLEKINLQCCKCLTNFLKYRLCENKSGCVVGQVVETLLAYAGVSNLT